MSAAMNSPSLDKMIKYPGKDMLTDPIEVADPAVYAIMKNVKQSYSYFVQLFSPFFIV